MRKAQKAFDKQVLSAKREYWRQAQEELLNLSTDNCNEFWKKIGKIVIGEKKSNIPWEVVDGDTVYKNPKVVLNKWGTEFENLLNPAPVMQQDINTNQQSQQGNVSDPYLDTAITYLEYKKL